MAFDQRIPEGSAVQPNSIATFARVARLTGRAAAWRLNRLLSDRLPDRPFRVLDIGTGPASIPTHLRAFWPKADIVALDISPEMLQEAVKTDASRGARLRLLAGDGLHLPFGPAVFDVVVCLFTLHHVDHPEAFLQEACRVLQPSGLLFVLDFRRDMGRLRFRCFDILWRTIFCLSAGRQGFSESVQSAWRPAEIEALTVESRLDTLTVHGTKTELIISNKPPYQRGHNQS